MSKTLAGKAAALANGNGRAETVVEARQGPPADGAQAEPGELPDIDPGDSPDDWDKVPVHIAWLRLMGDIRGIAKSKLYNAAGTRFNYRSADQVVNVFGPLQRKHGILVLPVDVVATYRDTTTTKGAKMHECVAKVSWMVMGPTGDVLPKDLTSVGEALDTMDKSSAKAQTVALRVLLTTAAMVPTGDPDPDSVTGIERGEATVRPPSSYATEILDRRTSRQRMLQIRHELAQHRMAGALAMNEHRQQEPLGVMVDRVDRQRYEEWQRSQQQAAAPPPAPPVDDGVPMPPDDVAARLAAEQAALFAGADPSA